MDLTLIVVKYLDALVVFGRQVAVAATFGLVLELLLPYERQSIRSWLRAAAFWTVYSTFAVIVYHGAGLLIAFSGVHPAFSFDFKFAAVSEKPVVRLLAFTVLPFAAVLVLDFFYYWYHRAQHTIPLLWRFHRTHHSIEELNSLNCYHHLSESIWHSLLITVPMSLLVGVFVSQTVATTFFIGIFGQISHSNCRISFGIARYVFLEPRYHRLHHSIDSKHHNKNFAFMFPIWDILFGTAIFPDRSLVLKTGLVEQPEAQSFREYLLGGSTAQPNSASCTSVEVHTQKRSRVQSSSLM